MLRITRRSRILKLGLALFLTGQVFSVAHASEFGHAPHEHNGVQCAAIVNNNNDDDDNGDEQEGLGASASPIASHWTVLLIALLHTTSQAPQPRMRALRPPATGPPSI